MDVWKIIAFLLLISAIVIFIIKGNYSLPVIIGLSIGIIAGAFFFYFLNNPGK